MKYIIIVALLACTNVMAIPTEKCIANHFAAAKQNPAWPYEKDKEIVRNWCQCRRDQELSGKNEVEQIEFCVEKEKEKEIEVS